MSNILRNWKEGILTQEIKSPSGNTLRKGELVRWKETIHYPNGGMRKHKMTYFYVDVNNENLVESNEFLITIQED